MLEMTIDPNGASIDEKLTIEPPYEFVATFIGDDIQHMVENARSVVAELRGALAGKPMRDWSGNAWSVEADAEKATLTVLAAGEPEPKYELPTAKFLEAMERWLQYLESREP